MSQGPGIWIGAVVASIVLNVGAGAGLLAALLPTEIPEQPMPESRLNVEAQEVTRSDATEQAPESAKADESALSGAQLGAGAIAQSSAKAMLVPAVQGGSKPLPATAVKSALAKPVIAAQAELTAVNSIAAAPQNLSIASAKLTAVNTPPMRPDIETAPTADLPGETTRPQQPDVPLSGPADPVVLAGLQQQPKAAPVPEQAPEVTKGKAELAFPGDGAGSVDPVSLTAFQSFTQSGTPDADQLRDSVNDALSVPCSRMQVTFDPDSTTLRLNGHIPSEADRAPVLAALQARMGADIAVADNLLILPAPQCAALSGIASVGLPQSTDQITNPLIVGADTHARAFRYVKDQPLVIELTAPDYPAYVYVDYFDADGNVIHLSPNERAPLQAADAKSALTIGARSAEEAGLYVVIGPPYGQEIAVAFATSVPLYDGLRPLVEPADAYLDWMKGQVAAARARDPGFKGEWVYFFVTTAAQ